MFVPHDLDIMPCDAAAPARAESFKRGFFRGEACGIVRPTTRAARGAICYLGEGENSPTKARRAVDRLLDAGDFDEVNAGGYDH